MLRKTVVITGVLLLLAAVAATSSAAGPPLVLSGINEREANGDAHAFELYGDFPDNANIRPIVFCNGKLMQAEIMAPPLATQINVNVEAMAAGSNCIFSVQRLSDGVRSGTRSVVTTAVPIQINGIADRGVTNGRRFVELYGNFASASTLQARVVCGARYAGERLRVRLASTRHRSRKSDVRIDSGRRWRGSAEFRWLLLGRSTAAEPEFPRERAGLSQHRWLQLHSTRHHAAHAQRQPD
jgi:hypothetical protein